MPKKVTEHFIKQENGELVAKDECGVYKESIKTISFKIGDKFIKLKPDAFLMDTDKNCTLSIVVG
jgi:hypothetical protein